MNKRLVSALLAFMLLLGMAAGCGDDSGDDGGDDGGADTTETDSGDTGGEGASAEVEKYCQEAEELGAQLQDVIDDPTSADAAEITAQATELTTAAADLINSNPDDVARINECSEALQVTP